MCAGSDAINRACFDDACRPHERTADELRRLGNFLSQEVPWFAGFTKQLVTEVSLPV
jgi:hypothetical protein